MKQFFQGPLENHSRNIMRSIGYGEQRTRQGQISFVRRVGSDAFPRYHAYVEDRDGGMQVNLHVDQKAASYQGSSAHSGEYDGPLVEREMSRIASTLTSSISTTSSDTTVPRPPAPKSRFF